MRIFEGEGLPATGSRAGPNALIAAHPVLEGKNQRRVDPRHRTLAARPRQPEPAAVEPTLRRPLAFCDAVGQRLAAGLGEGASS